MKLDTLHPIFKAVIFTIIPFASLHLIISNVYAFVNGAWDELNYFHILAIDLIWPELGHGMANFWLSQVMCWSVYIWWVLYLWRKYQKAKAGDAAQ